MNTFSLSRNDSMPSGAPAANRTMIPSFPTTMQQQDDDRSVGFRKVSSRRSVILDPYSMDFSSLEEDDDDDSSRCDLKTTSSTSFAETPKQALPNVGFRLSLKPLHSGRNIFADDETSYIPSGNLIVDDETITMSSTSSECMDANYYVGEDRINHLLSTPRTQDMWDSPPSTPRPQDSQSNFHVVSPSQPNLPYLSFWSSRGATIINAHSIIRWLAHAQHSMLQECRPISGALASFPLLKARRKSESEATKKR